MPFDMSEGWRAERADLEDGEFPDWMGVWAEGDDLEPLGALPCGGNGLWVLCCVCWEQRWIGGEELCRRWPEWLIRPGTRWARALRCDACDQRRFCLMAEADPAAAGFQLSPEDTALTVAVRRLTTWLDGGPVRLEDLARVLALA